VYAFILKHIDSVPHLEALLLLWDSRPTPWSPADLAARLYIETAAADRLLSDLVRQGLAARSVDSGRASYRIPGSPDIDRILPLVSEVYRRELVSVSMLIHSKASSAVRDFAKAFRFKKEEE
jgi:hypothetical protein